MQLTPRDVARIKHRELCLPRSCAWHHPDIAVLVFQPVKNHVKDLSTEQTHIVRIIA